MSRCVKRMNSYFFYHNDLYLMRTFYEHVRYIICKGFVGILSLSLWQNALLYCAVCIEVMNVINTVPFPLCETEIGFLPQETFYKHVIGEVCRNMREAFMNEGVDEQVLTELKEVNTALRCFSVIVKYMGLKSVPSIIIIMGCNYRFLVIYF